MMERDPFSFWVPLDLEKSLDDGERRICGIISTEDLDLDGERILEEGADYSPMMHQMGKNLAAAAANKLDFERFSARQGFLKYEHHVGECPTCHAGETDNIVGIPDRVEKGITFKDGVTKSVRTGTAIWGRLFAPGLKKSADDLWNLMVAIRKSGFDRRLGYSIEGAYVQGETDAVNKSCLVTSVVVTQRPVNSFTWADMAKALTAGGGTDSAQMAGGAALRRQSHHGFTCNHVDENGKLKSHRDALEHAVKCMGKDIDTAKKAVVLAYRRAA